MKPKEETNKALVIKAMDTLFNKHDFAVGVCTTHKDRVNPDLFEFIES